MLSQLEKVKFPKLTGAEAGLLCMIQQQTAVQSVHERSDNENPVVLPCGLVSHRLFSPLCLSVFFRVETCDHLTTDISGKCE